MSLPHSSSSSARSVSGSSLIDQDSLSVCFSFLDCSSFASALRVSRLWRAASCKASAWASFDEAACIRALQYADDEQREDWAAVMDVRPEMHAGYLCHPLLGVQTADDARRLAAASAAAASSAARPAAPASVPASPATLASTSVVHEEEAKEAAEIAAVGAVQRSNEEKKDDTNSEITELVAGMTIADAGQTATATAAASTSAEASQAAAAASALSASSSSSTSASAPSSFSSCVSWRHLTACDLHFGKPARLLSPPRLQLPYLQLMRVRDLPPQLEGRESELLAGDASHLRALFLHYAASSLSVRPLSLWPSLRVLVLNCVPHVQTLLPLVNLRCLSLTARALFSPGDSPEQPTALGRTLRWLSEAHQLRSVHLHIGSAESELGSLVRAMLRPAGEPLGEPFSRMLGLGADMAQAAEQRLSLLPQSPLSSECGLTELSLPSMLRWLHGAPRLTRLQCNVRLSTRPPLPLTALSSLSSLRISWVTRSSDTLPLPLSWSHITHCRSLRTLDLRRMVDSGASLFGAKLSEGQLQRVMLSNADTIEEVRVGPELIICAKDDDASIGAEWKGAPDFVVAAAMTAAAEAAAAAAAGDGAEAAGPAVAVPVASSSSVPASFSAPPPLLEPVADGWSGVLSRCPHFRLLQLPSAQAANNPELMRALSAAPAFRTLLLRCSTLAQLPALVLRAMAQERSTDADTRGRVAELSASSSSSSSSSSHASEWSSVRVECHRAYDDEELQALQTALPAEDVTAAAAKRICVHVRAIRKYRDAAASLDTIYAVRRGEDGVMKWQEI